SVAAILVAIGTQMHWEWVAQYRGEIGKGILLTLILLVSTSVAGFLLAIPLGLAQARGPRPLAWLARGFCNLIRGTPLLLQLWILYYGLGSLF
ncbi:ABC transporter permease subunit, partial [Chryseobacterium sp. SIMBA_038]